jgi:hypothetical protein
MGPERRKLSSILAALAQSGSAYISHLPPRDHLPSPEISPPPVSSFLELDPPQSPPLCSVLAEAFNRLLGCAVLSGASDMGEKRKASGDAPGTSPLPARIRTASTEDEDVSHGGGVLFVFLVSAPPWFLGFWCHEFDFLAPCISILMLLAWFLGFLQTPGAAENAGGWRWIHCLSLCRWQGWTPT